MKTEKGGCQGTDSVHWATGYTAFTFGRGLALSPAGPYKSDGGGGFTVTVEVASVGPAGKAVVQVYASQVGLQLLRSLSVHTPCTCRLKR